MSSVKRSLLAGVAAAALCGAYAEAADYTPPPQQVIYQQVPVPVPVQDFGGWYLRGDIGMSNQKLKEIHDPQMDTAPNFAWIDKGGFDSAPIFGLGVGYQYNDWLRFDLTGEYRGKSNFYALDRYFEPTDNPGWRSNEYTATKREWLFLANAYLDLGTWWCVTPFIGAGIGFANITIDHYRDVNQVEGGVGVADSHSTTNFAWALHAGLAYKVTPNFTVELAYRYLSLGDGETGDVMTYLGQNEKYNPVTFNDITSHDLKFGVRWNLQDSGPGVRPAFAAAPASVYAQPQQQVITMPQQQVIAAPPQVIAAPPQPLYQPQYSGPPPVYQPQPQYAPPPPAWQHQQQPPLMRRG